MDAAPDHASFSLTALAAYRNPAMFHYSPPLVAAALILALLPFLTLLPAPGQPSSAQTKRTPTVTAGFSPSTHGDALRAAIPFRTSCEPLDSVALPRGPLALALIPLGLAHPLLASGFADFAPPGDALAPLCQRTHRHYTRYPS